MAPLFACDAWQAALDVYRRNLDPDAFRVDLSNPAGVIRRIMKLNPDLIAGGPPCTEFSSAGKRIEGEQARLMASFGETVLRVRPTWFVMENVPRARNSRVFGTRRRRFKRAGYGVTEVILDASRCGAPQRRRRFICVGRLGAGDQFLAGALIGGLAPKPMTLRDRFGASLGRHLYFTRGTTTGAPVSRSTSRLRRSAGCAATWRPDTGDIGWTARIRARLGRRRLTSWGSSRRFRRIGSGAADGRRSRRRRSPR